MDPIDLNILAEVIRLPESVGLLEISLSNYSLQSPQCNGGAVS